MKTKHAFTSTSIYWLLDIPAGAAVIFVPGQGGGYAIDKPQQYGLNEHDARYRYVWVAPDNVEGMPNAHS